MPLQKQFTHHCSTCSALLVRKNINGRMEDFAVFQRRKYCNRQCMAKGQEKPETTLTRNYLTKKMARPYLKPQCELCATVRKLSIHHKDRNWRNNHPDNLQTLCASCHTSLHHRQGDILPPVQPKPPCACGKPSYRAGVCNTCRTRKRTARIRASRAPTCSASSETASSRPKVNTHFSSLSPV